jgi:hypothetical protein
MAFTITPLSGIDLNNTAQVNSNSAGTSIPTFGPTGAEVFGSDGLRYVFAQAAVAIGASTATCVVNASTFQVTLGAGTYISGASMASGDYGWFGKASV